ncbi:MAG: hypothetical protein K2Q10_09000, partial [Rhodospirillales bacterium]|nr:hypothetical protein [Rhodospirillales bacterium]
MAIGRPPSLFIPPLATAPPGRGTITTRAAETPFPFCPLSRLAYTPIAFGSDDGRTMPAYVINCPPFACIQVVGGGMFPIRRIYCVGRNY